MVDSGNPCIEIGGKKIGDGYPTFVMAEMAWSHDGSVNKAKKIIDGAANAKADAINFHITSLPDYMVPQYGSGTARVSAGHEEQRVYDYLISIDLTGEDWQSLFVYAKEKGLLISTMCNDLPSIEFTTKLDPDAYVLPSSCFSEEDMVRAIAQTMKPVFLRIGGAFLGEIEKTVLMMEEEGNKNIVLIHGFQSYPTKLEDMNLTYIRSLKQIFGLPVGFADHTDGDSPLALIVPLIALPFGANVIDKHITHDRSLRGEDFESALNPDELIKLVQNIREIEKAFGSPSVRPFSEAELNYRQVCRKRSVAKKTIKKDEEITKEKIAFKRSDEGVYPDESEYLVGRTAKGEIAENEPITWDKIV